MENKEGLELTPAEDTAGKDAIEASAPVEEEAEEAAALSEEAADEITSAEADAEAELSEAENEVEEALDEETSELVSDDGAALPDAEYVKAAEADEAGGKKKKRPFIQIPVIISLIIVVAALLGYFGYTAFFLREPQGVTWFKDYDGVTYYFEFKDDGVFKSYVGSVELTGTYEKQSDENGEYLVVSADAGDFYAGQKASYSITGSRILGNQELKIDYGEGKEATFTQSKGREELLELPVDFVADEKLVGSWSFKYYGYEYCVVTFSENGSMKIDYTMNGVAYNGTYTLENGNVVFTYYVGESIAQPIEYTVNGDVLTFMDMQFTRVGSDATVDEIVIQ